MYITGMKLAEWMEWKAVSDKALASRVGVARASISRLRRGKMNPSMELARRLYAATDGAVQPNDLVDLQLSLKRRRA